MMSLRLIAIGALGTMLGPSAQHLRDAAHVHYVRILDRGTAGEQRQMRREAFAQANVPCVATYPELVGEGDFDGVVICAGKNGDDQQIFLDLLPWLAKFSPSTPFFILHFSTVSCAFVRATLQYCQKYHIQYVNYPLTGGALGAESGKMLILTSGSKILFERVRPYLETIGVPEYFGEEVTQAAAVKFISHIGVFHSLLGVSLAAFLHKQVTDLPHLSKMQVAFFDFLNQGAGGSKQWELMLRNALLHNQWDRGFFLKHAAIDALYTVQLLLEQQLPKLLVLPLLEIALLMIYLLRQSGTENSTTAAVSKLIAETSSEQLDHYLQQHLSMDIQKSFKQCIELLPDKLQKSLMVTVVYQ